MREDAWESNDLLFVTGTQRRHGIFIALSFTKCQRRLNDDFAAGPRVAPEPRPAPRRTGRTHCGRERTKRASCWLEMTRSVRIRSAHAAWAEANGTALDVVVDLVVIRRGRPGPDFPGSLKGSIS